MVNVVLNLPRHWHGLSETFLLCKHEVATSPLNEGCAAMRSSTVASSDTPSHPSYPASPSSSTISETLVRLVLAYMYLSIADLGVSNKSLLLHLR